MNPIDHDTQKILTDAEEVRNTLSSKGWSIIAAKLTERILDLQNINNLDDTKPETLTQQLMSRKMAADELFKWLKIDAYGSTETPDMKLQTPDDHIQRT